MNTIHQYATRVRWRWILPIIMIVLTAALWLLGTFKLHAHPGAIDVSPLEYILAAFLDYPAFLGMRFLPSINIRLWDVRLGLEVLPAIFIQWALIGLAIDRRRGKASLIKNRSANLATVSLGFAISLVLLVEARTDWRSFYELFKDGGFWNPGLMYLAAPLWAILGVAYFGRKVWTDVWSFFSNEQRLTPNDLRTTKY